MERKNELALGHLDKNHYGDIIVRVLRLETFVKTDRCNNCYCDFEDSTVTTPNVGKVAKGCLKCNDNLRRILVVNVFRNLSASGFKESERPLRNAIGTWIRTNQKVETTDSEYYGAAAWVVNRLSPTVIKKVVQEFF